MMKAYLLGGAGIAVAFGMLTFGYMAGRPDIALAETAPQHTSRPAETALDRQQVEAIVRDYLLANPEIMLEVQAALETKQKQEQRVAQLEVIRNAKADIFDAAHDGVVGNPQGKVTVVEFYDYNCGYCRRALSDMEAMTAADPDLRFVLKELPILGPDSHKAHIVSMAFRALMPEKFGEFHRRLLSGPGRADEQSAIKVALALGADERALREEMKNPAIEQAFSKTYELANQLSITGTPSYVVGEEVVFGALGADVLSEKVAAAKACSDGGC